jgi:hypothetical protein
VQRYASPASLVQISTSDKCPDTPKFLCKRTPKIGKITNIWCLFFTEASIGEAIANGVTGEPEKGKNKSRKRISELNQPLSKMLRTVFSIGRYFGVTVFFVTSVALTLYSPPNLYGQQNYALPFLMISPSAAANGMGGGFVAASTEVSAIHYNPAALTRLGRVAIEGNTFKVFPNINNNARYYYAAGAIQINWLKQLWLGVAYTRLGLGTFTVADIDGPDPIAVAGPRDWAIALSAAQKFGQHARFGIGFKYIRSIDVLLGTSPVFPYFESSSTSASTFAFDFGFLYEGFLPRAHFSHTSQRRPLPWEKWSSNRLPRGLSLGVALANIGPKIEYRSRYISTSRQSSNPLPQNLRIGLLWNIYDSDDISLFATGQFAKILTKARDRHGHFDPVLKALFTAWSDQSMRDELSAAIYQGGFEVSIMRLAAIRFGRHWDGKNNYGYNTFGYSIGPPGLRFSFAKIAADKYFSTANWRIYTAAIVLDKLP